MFGRIAEIDARKFDRAANLRRADWLKWAFDFFGRIEHFEHSLGAVEAGLNRVGDVGDLPHLVGKLIEQIRKHEQAGAERQLTVNDQIPAISQQDHHVELRQAAHYRLEDADSLEDALFLLEHIAIRI